MSMLRSSITRSRNERRTPLPIPGTTRVEQAAAKIPDPSGTEGPREGRDYDAIARNLIDRCRAGDSLSHRDLRDGAWCLWETRPALAGSTTFGPVLTGIDRSDRRSPFRALASSFMASFDPAREGISAVAQVLARKASSFGQPWADLQARFQLFDIRNGPDRVAKAALGSNRSPTAVLGHYGLGTLNAESGYAKACTAALLAQLARDENLAPEGRLKLIRSVALRNDRLIFDDHAPLVADALLLPFAQSDPEEHFRKRVLDLALGLFGDPRLNPQRWVRMRDAEAIVRRWLVRASLLQFLEVVGQVEGHEMWKPRRTFWQAVHRADLIRDAWVVFDSSGARRAKQSFGNELRFATFDRGVIQGQAVLMLAIGGGLVVEWSSNGKCIIWNDVHADDAPRMYRPHYSPSELRHASATSDLNRSVFATSHIGAWQDRVAAKIREVTGVGLRPSRYIAQ